MRIHVVTRPAEHSFDKEFRRPSDRRKLAVVMENQLYDIDWAAVYIDGAQYMFFDKPSLIKALQYDKYDYGSPSDSQDLRRS